MSVEFWVGGLVNVPQEIPEALDRLDKNSDVFWGMPDQLVLNPQTAKHILPFSFQKRIPSFNASTAGRSTQAPASAWQFVKRLWSATAGVSGWNQSPERD